MSLWMMVLGLARRVREDVGDDLLRCDGSRAPGSRCRSPARARRPSGWWIMTRAFGSARRRPLVPGREEHRAPSTRPCRGTSCDTVRAHVLHRVVDREAARHHAAGAVDVEHDLLVGILALQKEKLGDDDVRDVVVDLGPEEDDPVLQQAAEDVPVALAAVRRLDDRRVRDEVLRRARCVGSPACGSRDAWSS